MTKKPSMATPSTPQEAAQMLATYQRKYPVLQAELTKHHAFITEYKALLMDILDAVEEAADLATLRRNLWAFDIELIEGQPHPLRDWWVSQRAKEAGRGAEFYEKTEKAS